MKGNPRAGLSLYAHHREVPGRRPGKQPLSASCMFHVWCLATWDEGQTAVAKVVGPGHEHNRRIPGAAGLAIDALSLRRQNHSLIWELVELHVVGGVSSRVNQKDSLLTDLIVRGWLALTGLMNDGEWVSGKEEGWTRACGSTPLWASMLKSILGGAGMSTEEERCVAARLLPYDALSIRQQRG